MKYTIIGAGGTGGAIGGFLARAGKDVTLIARGEHLRKMREHGLQFETPTENYTVPVQACTMDEYTDTPDVIIVCVKGYSLDETLPFIQRIAAPHTVIIPILNIYGTGKKMQALLPQFTVTDGCIYIVSQISRPGTILMSGTIFRVVFGLRKDTDPSTIKKVMPVLELIRDDLSDANITPLLSSAVERDTLQKFSFVSPMAALGAGFDVTAGAVQTPGKLRDFFIQLVQEVKALSDAMGVGLPDDIVDINLKLMDGIAPDATASMHRDIRDGKQSEADGLVHEVVRLGAKYHIPVPAYEAMSARLQGK